MAAESKLRSLVKSRLDVACEHLSPGAMHSCRVGLLVSISTRLAPQGLTVSHVFMTNVARGHAQVQGCIGRHSLSFL